jgi:protein-disulfide isomerase
MRLYISLFFTLLFLNLNSISAKAEMTLNELIFDESKSFNLKILDAIPDAGKIQIGEDYAKHTIIEFFDYFCGYCKKIHSELVDLVKSRDDVRVIFLQHPILNESSKVIARVAIAANMQNKGFDFHDIIFSMEGSITSDKLAESIKQSGVNEAKLNIDMDRDEVKKIIKISSFLASASGARGTPAIFINDTFYGGYLPRDRIEALLQ